MTRDKQIDPLKWVSSFVSHLFSDAGVNWIFSCLSVVEKQHVVVKPTCKLEHFTEELPWGSTKKLLEFKNQKSKKGLICFPFLLLFQVVSCLKKISLLISLILYLSPYTVKRFFIHRVWSCLHWSSFICKSWKRISFYSGPSYKFPIFLSQQSYQQPALWI